MTKLSFYATYLALFLGLAPWAHGQQAGSPPGAAKPRALAISGKPWNGDFDQMLERRHIRVLVPYSRTLYFIDKGHERGLTAELVRDFERYINQKYAKQLGKRPITVYPDPDHARQAALRRRRRAGRHRRRQPHRHRGAAARSSISWRRRTASRCGSWSSRARVAADRDARGSVRARPCMCARRRSYYESLVALNAAPQAGGQGAGQVVELPDALEDEDMLEMLNAGLIEFIVVDDWKAKMWAQVLPKIKVREDLVAARGGHIGWADAQGQPQARCGELTDFYKNFVKKQGMRRVSLQRSIKAHQADQQQHRQGADWKRFEADRRAVREVRRAVRLRSADAGGAGLPGIAARPERAQPRRARSA